jgi:alpha-ribazole phosphatase
MILTLIRHTRVDIPTGLIYGQTDVPLAKTFEDEAAAILKKLEGITFDSIYSSPLSRCRLLAERIAETNQVVYDNRLLEMNFGVWEGKLWTDVETTSEATEWFKNYFEVACPEGESYAIVYNRIQLFLNDIKAKSAQNCCVVTHGGQFRAFLSIIEDQTPQTLFNRKIDYGEVIQVEI